MRIVGFSTVLLVTFTGVVMAANPGCQVALHWETVRAQKALAHKVHHSAATLARWKVGAAAWSKTHHGKVYAGRAPAQFAMVWKPLTYRCDDIALVTDFTAPLLTGEVPPEFNANALASPSDAPALDIYPAQNAPTEQDELLPPVYGGPVGGMGRVNGPGAPANDSVGPASFSPIPPEPTPPHMRLLPPRHQQQQVTLLPTPLPVIVPTPEPSTMVLLSTGLAALGMGWARKQPSTSSGELDGVADEQEDRGGADRCGH